MTAMTPPGLSMRNAALMPRIICSRSPLIAIRRACLGFRYISIWGEGI